jgi:hypothetical protein
MAGTSRCDVPVVERSVRRRIFWPTGFCAADLHRHPARTAQRAVPTKDSASCAPDGFELILTRSKGQLDCRPMNWLYDLIGKIFFRRLQDWERRKNAKTMVFVILFSLALALVMAKILKMMYFKSR